MEDNQLKLNENLLFLRSFIHSPKNVGSVIPSSRFLATKMVKQAPWNEVKAVAELGSGTGAITRFINTQVSEATKVLLFEMDETMRDNLQTEYPDFSCHPNAARLVEAMKQENIQQLDCIFSGLPFFNFERELRDTLVEQIYKALKPGGLFIAFQYSLQMKKQLSERFIIEKINWVPLNIPPAFVYVCRKKETM
ncbi:phospholipid methyltransferase [Paenibacillus jamilae]|uniref:Phospholipid methyltransferase n=1 Tax=Paenibacillus jamilae TaxID=114136 RepID=A0ACC4ZNU3_9BACL|nr:phospholipid methyltransferase [Paenibacillus jamilae]